MLTTGCAARAASFRLEGCRREGATLIVERPSPNHAPRPEGGTVDVLVLHYTELPLQESLNVLTDGTRPLRVSSHYVLAEDGTVYRLVPEDRVAWHAGISYWRGHERLNETSIGIEIVNLDGDKHDYPPQQIAALFPDAPEILENVLEGLFDIAQADGKVGAAEAEYLAKVAQIFGLSSARVERARAAALGQAECEPCVVLGIDPLATDEQIRDAWLRQVKAHHPDRLMAQGLPEEAIKVANRKLALINDAYDRLRRARGLVPA